MTVREIAEKAGVSPATVSRFLKDKLSVNAESRERLQTVLKDCDEESQPKRRVRRSLIAVLLPHLRLQFYQCALRELMEQAPSLGVKLVILPALSDDETGWADRLDQIMPLGVISLEAKLDRKVAVWLKRHPDVRVAVLAEESLSETACTAHINDLAAAYEGTQYLLSLGHRRICFFSNRPSGISTSFQRQTGSRKAMSERNLSFDENVRYGELTYDKGYALADELMRKERDNFTAIFAYSDEMAVGAIMALRDHGVSVPEDMSVLGIDDLPIASYVRPQLTTIHQPLGDMARYVLTMATEPTASSRSVILPHRLIKRGTCRAVKGDMEK